MGTEIFHALKATLRERGLGTDGRRRGRLRARPRVERGGARVLVAGIEAAGYEPGDDASSPSTRRPARSTASPTAPTCSSTRAGR